MPLQREKQVYSILRRYTMKINIHEFAAKELDEAIEWQDLYDETVIWAIVHMHRKPRFWQSRMQE